MSSLGSAGDDSRECILHNEPGRILAPSVKYCASYCASCISHTLCLEARRQFLEEFSGNVPHEDSSVELQHCWNLPVSRVCDIYVNGTRVERSASWFCLMVSTTKSVKNKRGHNIYA